LKNNNDRKYCSDHYLNQLRTIHNKVKWGGSVIGKINEIAFFLKIMDENEVLDYGAGYGCLKEALNKQFEDRKINVIEYDPGISHKSKLPDPCKLLVCVDVLEHIEPEYLNSVLDHLQELTLNIGYIGISLTQSHNSLPDGRNAHLIVESFEWWKEKLAERFEILKIANNDNYCKFIVKKIKNT